MIFSILSRSLVLVSAGAAALIVADVGAPAIPSFPLICVVAALCAIVLSRVSLPACLFLVLPSVYLSPAAFLLTQGHDHWAYAAIWICALLGVIGGTAPLCPWSLPARWRWALVTWATVVACSWPVVSWRALDFTWPLLWGDRPVVLGVSGRFLVGWLAYAALVHLVGLLWIDWLYRTYEGTGARFRREIVAPLAAGILVACIVGIYQATVDPWFLSGHVWPRLERAAGTLMDANVFGNIAAFWTALFLVFVLDGSLPFAVLGGAGFLLSWLGMWASGSRISLIVAVIGTVLGSLHLANAYRTTRRRFAGRFVIAAAALAFAIVLVAGPRVSTVALDRIRVLIPSPSWESVKHTAVALWERDGYGQAAVAMMADHPLTGVGSGAYYYLVHSYAVTGTGHTLFPDNAQNWFRHQAAELGAIGSIGWLVWCAVLAFDLWPRARRQTGPGSLLRGVLLGFGLGSLVGVPGQDPAIVVTFWMVAFWYSRDTDTVASTSPMGRAGWAATIVIALGYTALSGRATGLRPPYLAARFGSPYSYGLIVDRASAGLSGKHGVAVLTAEGPWLKLTFWVDDSDADREPVRVEIWRDRDRIVRRRISAHVPLTVYAPVGGAGSRFVLETKTDRVLPPDDSRFSDGAEPGLKLKWEYVSAPPSGLTELVVPISPHPSRFPQHQPEAPNR